MCRETDPCDALGKLQMFTRALLDDIGVFEALELIYSEFASVIPFQRIGYAEVDTEFDRVTACWAKADGSIILRKGFSAPLNGSSLSIVLDQKKPRILNDLPAYLEHRPDSKSTRLIVKEGYRSSLTVPVFLGDTPIGFIFFSSRELDAFTDFHVGLSMELSVLVAMVHKHHSQASVDSAKSGSEQQLKPSSVELQSTEKQSSKSSAAAADNDESDSLTEEAYLSQLQPGMELRTPVKCADGTLLLASGTELTSQAIEKLTDLRNRGLLTHQLYQVVRQSQV